MPSRGGRARLRDEAARLLAAWEPGALERWAAGEPLAWRGLQPLLFHADALVRWRAAEGLGRVSAVRARADLEGVRELLRRALWLMNDESGGILWMGPQVLGAALGCVPALCGEFLDVLASFLEEEPFRAGTRWALWRAALARPAAVAAVGADALRGSLADPDPAVRGHAALALAACAGAPAPGLAGDAAEFELFDPRSGALRAVTVAEAASGRRR